MWLPFRAGRKLLPVPRVDASAEARSADAPRSAYGSDRFGRLAERLVRGFGTPPFLVCQTLIIGAWVAVNALTAGLRFDPYPFIFLNLMFSALAAYAAPFVLLAQTRQADRDKARADLDAGPPAALASDHARQRQPDSPQTEQIARLLEQNGRQTDHIGELLEQTRRLLERESDQTDLIAGMASRTIAMAQASHVLTREIHEKTVARRDGRGRQRSATP
jgi:uncharacterized membrane protein